MSSAPRPATVVVQLTAGPAFLDPWFLARWDDTVADARARGHQVEVRHLPLGGSGTQVPWASDHRGAADDVLVVARPQDVPSPTLVGDLAEAVAGWARVAGPRLLPLEHDLGGPDDGVDADPASARTRVRACLALRAGTLRELGDLDAA
ncbi:hypothetical protein [Nocardioides solisilvae]|uniref:hypothetical protein n=1 Tax=Nocardioides solisilvae TaxID=1542435 RepID=UPI000D74C495|nr:hypothetical protein [Nocardioides solisilvae]